MTQAIKFVHPVAIERPGREGLERVPPLSPEVQSRLEVLAMALRDALSSDEAFELLVARLPEHVPFDRLAFSAIDPETHSIRSRRLCANHPVLWRSEGVHLDWGSSLGPLLEDGSVRIIPDLKLYLRLRPSSEATKRLLEEGMRSSLALPLYKANEAFGFLFFSCARPEAYDTRHVSILASLAPLIGQALARAEEVDEIALPGEAPPAGSSDGEG